MSKKIPYVGWIVLIIEKGAGFTACSLFSYKVSTFTASCQTRFRLLRYHFLIFFFSVLHLHCDG